MKTLLFTSDYFKTNSNVDANVSDKLVIQSIIDAQDNFLEPILGSTLLNKLKDDGIDGDLTTLYVALLEDFVYPFLIKATEYELLIKLILRNTSQGLIKNVNADKENSTLEEYRILKVELEEKMDRYADKTIKYLEYNSTSFPEYRTISFDKPNATGNTMGQVYIDPEVQAYVRNMKL